MSTEDDIKFYDLTIDSCDWDSFYSPTLLSIPSYTTTDIKNNAVDARYTEYCYKLSETSNNSKCKIFKVAMPDSFLNEKNACIRSIGTYNNSFPVYYAYHTNGKYIGFL